MTKINLSVLSLTIFKGSQGLGDGFISLALYLQPWRNVPTETGGPRMKTTAAVTHSLKRKNIFFFYFHPVAISPKCLLILHASTCAQRYGCRALSLIKEVLVHTLAHTHRYIYICIRIYTIMLQRLRLP